MVAAGMASGGAAVVVTAPVEVDSAAVVEVLAVVEPQVDGNLKGHENTI